MAVLIGTAGWSLPRIEQQHFPGSESHLVRYATRFPVAEINSAFHRSHRESTWARWRDSVPANFRFSVKMPKTITHTAGLKGIDALLTTFLEETATLREKLGCLLVQLPPKLVFEEALAAEFFTTLRTRTPMPIVCEPRHPGWFEPEADRLLKSFEVARVATDPARVPAAASPGGWRGLTYYRLHGSPKVYYSSYSSEFIATLSRELREAATPGNDTWVIFDNTTLGAATRNALDLAAALDGKFSYL